MIDAVILGAGGYVGGELLRLVAGHSDLQLAAAMSRSRAGTPIAATFPHLRLTYGDTVFASGDELATLANGSGRLAVFSAMPHAQTAAAIDDLLSRCEANRQVSVVDTSADFRFTSKDQYESIYGEHAAPHRLPEFACTVPDLAPTGFGDGIPHRAQPGCFTTAVTMACAPLAASGSIASPLFVSAVTGSTGSGQSPSSTTHHPERHGGFKAYQPLVHRHRAEMEMILGAAASGGDAPSVAFVPHSGPFARGIHATVQTTVDPIRDVATWIEEYRAYYAHTPFVSVTDTPPQLKEVVGSHTCRIGLAVDGDRLVVMSAIDNLVRGSAGGAVQWMNQLLDLEPTAGLTSPALGWN